MELALDHHATNTGFAKRLAIDPHASSACEIVYDIFKAGEIEIDELTATCIYTGMATDTGSFKFDCTTPRCHEIAAEIIRDFHVPTGRIGRILFDIKSEERLRLETKIINSMQTYLDGKCAIIYISLDDLDAFSASNEDVEGVANIPMQIKGVEVGVTIKEKKENQYKISMRSAETIDVAEICKKFDGGGHIRAAGCMMDGDIDQVRMKILSAVAAEMGIDLWLA